MQSIEYLRKVIDDIDDNIIKLLEKRFETANNIGLIKGQTGQNILDKSREEYIYSKIKSGASKYAEQITEVYRQIMSSSKFIQKKQG